MVRTFVVLREHSLSVCIFFDKKYFFSFSFLFYCIFESYIIYFVFCLMFVYPNDFISYQLCCIYIFIRLLTCLFTIILILNKCTDNNNMYDNINVDVGYTIISVSDFFLQLSIKAISGARGEG